MSKHHHNSTIYWIDEAMGKSMNSEHVFEDGNPEELHGGIAKSLPKATEPFCAYKPRRHSTSLYELEAHCHYLIGEVT